MSLNSTANPFENKQSHPEWNGNNLILTNSAMRTKAGVSALDSDVSEIFNASHKGGAATGAPFHIKKYGSNQASPYEQTGAGYPMHYFANNQRW